MHAEGVGQHVEAAIDSPRGHRRQAMRQKAMIETGNAVRHCARVKANATIVVRANHMAIASGRWKLVEALPEDGAPVGLPSPNVQKAIELLRHG